MGGTVHPGGVLILLREIWDAHLDVSTEKGFWIKKKVKSSDNTKSHEVENCT